MFDGEGTMTWKDKNATYVGSWKAGKQHGKGTFTYEDGSKYDGEWKDNQRDGKGLMIWKANEGEFRYDGEWKKDMKDGQGTYTWPGSDKLYHKGAWSQNKRHG